MKSDEAYRILTEAPIASYAEYRRSVGEAFPSTLERLGPEGLLKELEASGLRGRGGAGFPTGKKWRTLWEAESPLELVVCNAAEGEPSTFKDRLLLRRNPYAVVEGLLAAAWLLDAHVIHVGLKERFVAERTALRKALDEMRAAGLYDPETLEIRVTLGPDAYLYGEETALMAVLEGDAPLPRLDPRPPYEWGLRAHANKPNPTLINNAESFARVPSILRHGAAGFREAGTEDTPGLVLYTLCGDVRSPGVYEASPDRSVGDLLEAFGGGPVEGHTLRGVIPGVAHGVLPADKFGVPADFGSLEKAGSGLGSAGFLAVDDSRSLPAVTAGLLRFLAIESCNQCPPCKQGMTQAWRSVEALLDPETRAPLEIEKARRAALEAPIDNRCHLPVQGRTLLLSLLEHFDADFEALARSDAPAVEPLPAPKLADYDPVEGVFVLDLEHQGKQLDWSWEGTPPQDAPLLGGVLTLSV